MNIWKDLGFSDKEAKLAEEKTILSDEIVKLAEENDIDNKALRDMLSIPKIIAEYILKGKIGNLTKPILEKALNAIKESIRD